MAGSNLRLVVTGIVHQFPEVTLENSVSGHGVIANRDGISRNVGETPTTITVYSRSVCVCVCVCIALYCQHTSFNQELFMLCVGAATMAHAC